METRSKVILALFTASIALCAGGAGFSLAWYASSANLRVETIVMEIDAQRSLKISLSEKKETFKDAIKPNEVKQVGPMTPVSSNFSSNWIGEAETPTFYDLSYTQVDLDGVPFLKSTRFGYYNEDIYLLCDTDAYITLDPAETTFLPNESANSLYARMLVSREGEYSESEYASRLNRVVKSMRAGLYVDGDFHIVDPYYEEDVLFGGALDNQRRHYYDYFGLEGDEAKEVFYGEVKDRSKLVYASPMASDSEAPEEFTCFASRHKKGVRPLMLEESLANGAEIAVEPSIPLESLDEEFPAIAIPVEANTPKKINLSLYLEGWDLDSVNGTMGASFDVHLSFKILRER